MRCFLAAYALSLRPIHHHSISSHLKNVLYARLRALCVLRNLIHTITVKQVLLAPFNENAEIQRS